jgi:glycine cleavage system H protein
MSGRDPQGLKFTASHEWLEPVEGDAVIGITDHAQAELGDIVFLELVAVGSRLATGDSFGSIESVKAVSELYSPLSGTVSARNEALIAKPETINTDPYGDGWMLRITPDDPSAFTDAALLSHDTYQSSLEG